MVMDNASYHRVLTEDSNQIRKIRALMQWLTAKGSVKFYIQIFKGSH